MDILQAAFILLFPWLILKFVSLNSRTAFFSPILLCYLVGVIIANLPFIPVNPSLSMSMAEIAVPLAIPLVLFSTDILKCLRLAKSTLLSFGLVIISVMTSSALGARLFASRVEESWQVAGMLVGVYTGGTPNLMAIGMGLQVQDETIILVNTADVLMGSLYIFFLLMLAKPLLSRILPPFQFQEEVPSLGKEDIPLEPLPFIRDRNRLKKIILALGLALAIVGFSVLLSLFITGEIAMVIVILSITTLGILGSLVKAVRTIEGTFDAGEYLLLVFALAVGTTINFRNMLSSNPAVFLYVAFVMTGAIFLHFFLAALFRIDVDTTLITSTAGIFGPPFIPPVAVAIKNKEVMVTGITISMVGLALGNYLGFLLAYMLAP